MSEPLTADAPEDLTAVDDAPVGDEAVEAGSGSSEKHIPAERFNGLMSKFNKTQDELSHERQYRLDLEARLQEFETRNNETTIGDNSMTDVAGLQTQVELLTKMLASQQVESVKRDVLAEFPDVAPFADLIDAGDAESFRNLAATLNDRVQLIKGVSSEPTPPTTPDDTPAPSLEEAQAPVPTQQEPPVFGGGSGQVGSSEPSQTERVADAIARKDFAAYMRAKVETATSGEDLVL